MTSMDTDTTNATMLAAQAEATDSRPPGEIMREVRGKVTTELIGVQELDLMAPGHLYNPRTGTGIEWLPASPDAGEPGKVRLWARQWNGQPTLLFESAHDTQSPWEYWYNLEFARSFPQVTHWWFDDAWTGQVRIWRPEAVEHDPESHLPMLIGWMRFGPTDSPAMPDALDAPDAPDAPGTPARPWTVVLTSPPRVNTPFPPMCASIANLPLQLLLGEKVMEVLDKLTEEAVYAEEIADTPELDLDIAVTSLVRREDLHRAFPNDFGSWCLDRLPGMTPREALCRVQGLEAESVLALS